MKLESYLKNLNTLFLTNILWNITFMFNYQIKLLNFLSKSYFYKWKINNYSDSYWFTFSNKKLTYELKWFK